MSRGAEWSKWDLHIHTPASLVQQYGADNEENWDRFLLDLENLPSEFTVVGINDYWFLDGYRKVLAAKNDGRLKNLKCIIPVIELRVNQFGGSASNLSRANLHVLFDPAISPAVIEAQFIGAMSSEFRLLPNGHEDASWSGVVTRDSLKDLGKRIKSSVPAERRGDYASDMIEGFNNLVVDLDSVYSVLRRPYFEDRTLTALGKVEWADIKWQEASIASKKNLVNKADLLFTAFEDPSRWRKSCEKLAADNVNSKLLDCSDAHTFSDNVAENNRVGRCSTWVRAESTFNGLVHALSEFEDRIFVGTEPSDIARRRTSPESIINWIGVHPVGNDSENVLFDYELDLNHGLVAIVGNKGQGKSALLDCIARAGNSSRDNDFAFLNGTRFLNSKNKARSSYQATISWVSGQSRTENLSHPHDPSGMESVEYLPQRLIERICASDPLSQEHEAFQSELRKVLFRHIPISERAEQHTLEDLIELRVAPFEKLLELARARTLNECTIWVELHRRLAENNLDDLRGQRAVVAAAIVSAEVDLKHAQEELRLATEPGGDGELSPLQISRNEIASVDSEIARLAALKDEALRKLSETRRRIGELADFRSEISVLSARAEELRLRINKLFPEVLSIPGPVVDISINQSAISGFSETLDSNQHDLIERVEASERAIRDLVVKREELRIWLEAEDTAREERRRAVQHLTQRVKNLYGSLDDAGTLNYLDHQIELRELLPDQIADVTKNILSNVRTMHGFLAQQRDISATLYGPAADFVASDDLAQDAGLEFRAELSVNASLRELSEQLDGRKNSELLAELEAVGSNLSVDDADDVEKFVADYLAGLCHERGDSTQPERNPHAAVKSSITLTDAIWQLVRLEWIGVKFSLTGSGLPLESLSPGQRGLILLLFYLVVDQNQVPLLLDQPEENLDNKAVRQVLVPALRRAKARRQIIMVTHNANLAIVGDADQIVYCSYGQGKFSLQSGPLSDLVTGENAVDVLEGTRPAFIVRHDKYSKVIPRPPAD